MYCHLKLLYVKSQCLNSLTVSIVYNEALKINLDGMYVRLAASTTK